MISICRHHEKSGFMNYSAGKDSHLTLCRALEAGFAVKKLFCLDAGKRHCRIFNEFPKTIIIRKHAESLGIPLKVFNIAEKGNPENEFLRAIEETARSLKNAHFFSSMDFEVDEGDFAFLASVREICSAKRVKYRSYLAKRDVLDIFAECEEKGIRSLIVSVDRNIDPRFLGNVADYDFFKYIENERRKGNFISANDFQTLVTESPVLDRKMKLISSERIKAGGKFLLKIKRFAFYPSKTGKKPAAERGTRSF